MYSSTICNGHGTCTAEYAGNAYVGLRCECAGELTAVYGPEIHALVERLPQQTRTVHCVPEAPTVRNVRLVPAGVAWLSATM